MKQTNKGHEQATTTTTTTTATTGEPVRTTVPEDKLLGAVHIPGLVHGVVLAVADARREDVAAGAGGDLAQDGIATGVLDLDLLQAPDAAGQAAHDAGHRLLDLEVWALWKANEGGGVKASG